MNTQKKQLNENLIDAAASEAIGANLPADTAAYQQELAGADESAQRLDRQMKEAVARMAAASPYMEPPANLRGRILQATAPTTFKMEDYRKATSDTGRFFRWGFYAALAFLAAGAWFNIATQQSSQKQVAMLKQQLQLRDQAIDGLVNPKADQIALKLNDKVAGKMFVNEETHTAVAVVPQGMLPAGKTFNSVTLTRDGKKETYSTIAVTADAGSFPQWDGAKLQNKFSVDNVAPDPQQKTYTARMGQ